MQVPRFMHEVIVKTRLLRNASPFLMLVCSEIAFLSAIYLFQLTMNAKKIKKHLRVSDFRLSGINRPPKKRHTPIVNYSM